MTSVMESFREGNLIGGDCHHQTRELQTCTFPCGGPASANRQISPGDQPSQALERAM